MVRDQLTRLLVLGGRFSSTTASAIWLLSDRARPLGRAVHQMAIDRMLLGTERRSTENRASVAARREDDCQSRTGLGRVNLDGTDVPRPGRARHEQTVSGLPEITMSISIMHVLHNT